MEFGQQFFLGGVPMHTMFFVQFDKGLKDEDIPKGFRKDLDYPVFWIDVIENESGGEMIRFLMADVQRKFRFIDSALTVRQPPHTFKKPIGNSKPRSSFERPIV